MQAFGVIPPAQLLLDALTRRGELEWAGYSVEPPQKVIWRWREPHDEVGDRLQHLIGGRLGPVAWKVLRHDRAVGGTNWCLISDAIIEVQRREKLATDASAAVWLREHEPGFVSDAARDFPDVVALLVRALERSEET